MEHYKYTKLTMWEYSRRVNWQNLKRSLPKMSPWEKKPHRFSEFFACILLMCYEIYLIACVQGETIRLDPKLF